MSQRNQKYFETLDLYGVNPKLYLNNQESYKTKFGFFLTITLIIIGVFTFILFGYDAFSKTNPQVIQSQKFLINPEKHQFEDENFNFVFFLQDQEQQIPYKDSNIFDVQLKQKIEIEQMDEVGHIQKQFKTNKIQLEQCDSNNFTGVNYKYLSTLNKNLSKMYCISKGQDIFMQGAKNSDFFSSLQLTVNKCTDDIFCEPEDILKDSFDSFEWVLLFQDTMLYLEDYENPFSQSIRQISGVLQSDKFNLVNVNFQDVKIENQFNFFGDNVSNQKNIQFIDQSSLSKNKGINSLEINLQLTNLQSTSITRNYKNIYQVLAQVAGILIIFHYCFKYMGQKVAGLYCQVDMVNEMFKFDYEEQEAGNYISEEEKKAQKKKKLEFSSYLSLIFCKFCQKNNEQNQKHLFDFAVKKLRYQLNVNKILNKLQELDKLKMVVLNDEQLHLFEYIPKPTVNKEIVEDYQFKLKNRKRQSSCFNNNMYIKYQQQQFRKKSETLNFLYEDKRNYTSRENQALEAFRQIQLKQKLTDVDRKLLEVMEPEQYQEFQRLLKKDNFNPQIKIENKGADDENDKEIELKVENNKNNNHEEFVQNDKSYRDEENFVERDVIRRPSDSKCQFINRGDIKIVNS